ncbi:MAG: penicillin acylase family protein, partial [Candidatus Thorarchaeota archaeon]
NNWVAAGSKTSTGYPILCNDPHLGLQTPSIWYEAHIVVPGELDVTGVTLPGLPGVILGHTDHMAWGFTNVGADVLDIFVEQLNPSNTDQYMYNGAYRDFEIVDETIHTKEGVDIPFQVKLSVHGPLIDSVTNTYDEDVETSPNLAMNWTGNAISHQIMGITLLDQATNLQEYYDALFWWDSPAQNIIYADDQGNIALTVCGRFPIRSGYSGQYPVQALNDSVGMVSNIPYAYIPRTVNPSQGYIQSANQISIDPSTYGFDLVGPFADGYRGRRADYLLSHDNSITMDDMKRFQADSVEIRAQEIVPFVIEAWNNAGDSNTTMDEIVGWFDDWDYSMEIEERAPTVWMFLREALHRDIFDEISSIDNRLPLSRSPFLEKIIRENISYYIDDHTTTTVENRDDILVRALYEAVDAIAADEVFGTNMSNWEYGNKHMVYYDHLADLTTVGGIPHRGQNTLNVAGGWRVTHGPSWRLVADLSDISQSYGVYSPGQSGNMFSPHFSDLFDLQYSFDETTQQYEYHMIYFYPTAALFTAADTENTMIEGIVTFVP